MHGFGVDLGHAGVVEMLVEAGGQACGGGFAADTLVIAHQRSGADGNVGGMSESDILIDDYSKNIKEWIAGGGKAIKMFNRVNGRSGAYFGPYTCSWLHPDMIVEDIKRHINDA